VLPSRLAYLAAVAPNSEKVRRIASADLKPQESAISLLGLNEIEPATEK
jgi:hypothetical protein